MNVLITGAAGFIGSNLMHFLAAERPQWKLWGLDLLTYAGNLANIASLIDANKAQFVRADIADSAAMSALFEQHQFDLVFHLAAESHVDRSILSAAEFVRTNVLGTQVLLTAALALQRAKRKIRFVHISTDEVYGSLGPTGAFVETTPLDPTSPYAASKAASDFMALAAHKTHALDVVITRCTNNYGPYQFPEKFIPLFITNCMEQKKLPLYGKGENVRSWIYVTDHCAGLLAAAEKGQSGEAYNIGGGPESEIPNIEVAKRVIRLLKAPETLLEFVTDRPAHDFRYAVDFSKATAELGWTPRVKFEEGLERTVQWYQRERPWWQAIKSGDYKEYYQRNYAGRINKTAVA